MRVQGFLNQHNLRFTNIDLDRNAHARNHLSSLTGKHTVPMVFFNEKHIGGWEELSIMAKEELDKLFDFVRNTEPSKEALALLDLANQEDEEFQCEGVDEYAALISKFKDSGLIKDHTAKDGRTFKHSFIGKEAINWLVIEKEITRHEAVDLMRQILSKHYGKEDNESFYDDDELYVLLEDNAQMNLNPDTKTPLPSSTPLSAAKAGKEIRMLMLSLYGKHLSEDGRKVNYDAIGLDPEFTTYITKTEQLQHVSLTNATREDKLAFFINIYNALVIHGFVQRGPPTNMWQRYKFFNTVCYVIDGHQYSLQDIENGVLRSNRKALGALRKPFSNGDPRLSVALSECEPRVHFALVCGAKSCPPIATYNADKIDKQLDVATKSFLGGPDLFIDVKKKEIHMSEILKWYSIDFGRNKHEVIQWVHDHLDEGEKKSQLAELLAGKFKLHHIPYNWDVNKK